ncbi:hypothetical protein [Rhodococcus qingshengii]|uniref:hypothetical protein n=1 Tax=Rhodococcus qingshengii TaxID=334542 RepID=UPI001C5F5C4D|nr:hypothetical protein [Rhodococcus qingshengii]MBW4818661.1 hypothetical protein [Rhodococcus qingshengii]
MEHRSGSVGGDLLLVADVTIDHRTDRSAANRLSRRTGAARALRLLAAPAVVAATSAAALLLPLLVES